MDQACPEDKVALNIKGLDRNNMPDTYAHAGRFEQGVVKPGEDVVSLPTHTTSNPPTEKVFTSKCLTNDRTRPARTTMLP